MSLAALKKHLSQVKIATLGSLCQVFNTNPDMIRCLLRHFIQKGSVRQCLKTPACGSKCAKCPASVTELYEWIGPQAVV